MSLNVRELLLKPLETPTEVVPLPELGEGVSVTVGQKAGVDGRLFGSVTNQDIADAFTNSGIEVKKLEVRLPEGPLKQIGEYDVALALHHDVVVSVKVVVQGEQ